MKGKMVTVNQSLDKETISKIVTEYGFTIKEEDSSKEDEILELKVEEISQDESLLETRPPVVTIMGHVDHGKTSLLDCIRKTNVAEREAGGITQHIGAYQVSVNDRLITFLDTPGHEAFTALRARGARATDIAILVVAADDGVMPQTIEAINHAKAASVPIIVAINKIDKPDANPEKIKQQLSEYDLIPEEWGGKTVMVPVSAKNKIGINDLLEMIILTADLQEIKSNPNKMAQGVIIESKLDKGKGPVATVLVQAGTLKIGDNFVVGSVYGKVRAMFNYIGKPIKEAKPSTPVQVIGFSSVPFAGEIFKVVSSDKEAKELAEKTLLAEKEKQALSLKTVKLESLSEQIGQGKVKELNLIIKTDVQGSAEALTQSLSKISVEDVNLKILHCAVGDVNENDVSLAIASSAIIIAFNVKVDPKAKELSEKENIDIRLYNIIYRVIEDIEKALKGLLEPELEEVYLGKAEVRAIFTIGKVNVVAGSYVLDGKITRNSIIEVIRNGKVIHKGKVESLKRFKDDVKEVNAGFEFGISIEKYNDFMEKDILQAYVLKPKTST
jgi:translation initiation factor IF-2